MIMPRHDAKVIVSFNYNFDTSIRQLPCWSVVSHTGCADALKEMLDKEYFPKGDGTKSMYILWCGPAGFNSIMDSELEKRDFYGFDEDCVFELPN
mmetsp:Transcript_21696/g.18011  ORF Transcript_21696/g.18011 Transcript_21696/m.18011 type:complete len:95 (-) Transcript_21696:9-293(-)